MERILLKLPIRTRQTKSSDAFKIGKSLLSDNISLILGDNFSMESF